MRKLLAILAINLLCTASADEVREQPLSNDTFAIAVPVMSRVIVQYRSLSDNLKVLAEKIVFSRCMKPKIEFKDILGDKDKELVLTVKGGGTGISVTQLLIYQFKAKRIHEVGRFELNRTEHVPPAFGDYSEELEGKVTFNEKGKLEYHYKRKVTEKRKIKKDESTVKYTFSSKDGKFVKAVPNKGRISSDSEPGRGGG